MNKNKRRVLIVVDMQKDFIDGSLGTSEAVGIVSAVVNKIKEFKDDIVIATYDTHPVYYLETQEGRKLPVEHCIEGMPGWQLNSEVQAALAEVAEKHVIHKPTFGSIELSNLLTRIEATQGIENITLIGLCTDICVISNAMISKATLPEVPIYVAEECCAGVTPDSHRRALEAMAVCQIEIV